MQTEIETFARWARDLEDREIQRSAVTRPVARQIVARRLKVVPGALEGLYRGRLKSLRHDFVERLRGLVADELTREIARLQRDLELARESDAGLDSDTLAAAQHAIEAARKLIEER